MNQSATIQFLNDIQLGSELTASDRQSLASMGEIVDVESGETLFRERELHPTLYWIMKGRVTLEMSTGGTNPKLLLTLGPGDLLAWSSMLSNGRMTSTAATHQPSRLLAMNSKQLDHLCSKNHEIGYRVMEHLAQRLADRLLATRLQLLDLFRRPNEAEV